MLKMKKRFALILALIGWFALIGQFWLSIENRVTNIPEAVARFFTYFTILTNIIVAVYFTGLYISKRENLGLLHKPGMLTAITLYIFMVGMVYQVALRHVWKPQGMQWVVNELLHTIIPFLVLVYWYLYAVTRPVKYREIFAWAIYPLGYLGLILARGKIASWYPYYFVDVNILGMEKALQNAAILTVAFLAVAALFLFIGKKLLKR